MLRWAVVGLAGAVTGWVIALALVMVLDRRERRRIRRFGSPEAYWHATLTRAPMSVDQRIARALVRRYRIGEACKNCFAPFSGPLAPLVRPLGHGPAQTNPSFCQRCSVHVPLGGAEVEITVLFADLRGSTALAEQLPAREFARLLNQFYETTVRVLVGHGALVDKLVGDQVMALFVPASAGADHARQALVAGSEILRSAAPDSHIGVGVHTGIAFVGVVGGVDGVTDFTAVGDTVNVAARLAAQARPGELLYTDDTARKALGDHTMQECLATVDQTADIGGPDATVGPTLMPVRGRQGPVAVYSVSDGAASTKRRTANRRRMPGFGWDSLSDAEHRVAILVAEGWTNREISKQLFMSPYTVDTHLRHVFAKLGLRSRAAVAAEATRRHAPSLRAHDGAQ